MQGTLCSMFCRGSALRLKFITRSYPPQCPPQCARDWVVSWLYPPPRTQLLFLSNGIFTQFRRGLPRRSPEAPSTAHRDADQRRPVKIPSPRCRLWKRSEDLNCPERSTSSVHFASLVGHRAFCQRVPGSGICPVEVASISAGLCISVQPPEAMVSNAGQFQMRRQGSALSA